LSPGQERSFTIEFLRERGSSQALRPACSSLFHDSLFVSRPFQSSSRSEHGWEMQND
jgi:hypothetical protein